MFPVLITVNLLMPTPVYVVLEAASLLQNCFAFHLLVPECLPCDQVSTNMSLAQTLRHMCAEGMTWLSHINTVCDKHNTHNFHGPVAPFSLESELRTLVDKLPTERKVTAAENCHSVLPAPNA